MSGPIAAAPGAATGEMRARILENPELVLEDPALMRALLERARGGGRSPDGKVIDLRTVAMDRLEERLDELEAAHRTVIAAAYDNLAGTQQIHRAVLHLLEAETLDEFADALGGDVAGTLRLRFIRLLVEGDGAAGEGDTLRVVPRGALTGRADEAPTPRVALRRMATRPGKEAPSGSEATLTLDLGAAAPAAALVLRSDDPDHLAPGQGTALLEFLAGVVERALRRWRE